MLEMNAQEIFVMIVLLAVPFVIMVARKIREKQSITVTVKIIDIDQVTNGDDVAYYPTFEIAAGQHTGFRYRSDWDCGASGYKLGEMTLANFFPETGEIYGNKITNREWFIWFYPAMLLGIFLSYKFIGVK